MGENITPHVTFEGLFLNEYSYNSVRKKNRQNTCKGISQKRKVELC